MKKGVKVFVIVLIVAVAILSVGMSLLTIKLGRSVEGDEVEVVETEAVFEAQELNLDEQELEQEVEEKTEEVTAEVVEEVTEEEAQLARIEAYIDDMTTDEKIGQLFMMDFRTDSAGNGILTLTDSVAQQIETYHLGGVILFAENLDTADQTTQLISDMQEIAELPLFIGIDEEGGVVSRLDNSNIEHESIPTAGDIESNEEAASTGTIIGEELVALGFNVDFAPVADVNTNPDNPVIGSRAYSSDAEVAAERVEAFVTALQDTGIAGAAKHFPGHGDTSTDSHYGTATVDHDLERLESVEFLPFESAIEAGVDMVLMGHIQVPNVTGDDIPASLNPVIVNLLRDDLGYDGVVITDAMNMDAIASNYGVGESAVMAIEAGVDIVLMPSNLDTAYTAVQEAVASGRITEENLADSVTRILLLKCELGIMEI